MKFAISGQAAVIHEARTKKIPLTQGKRVCRPVCAEAGQQGHVGSLENALIRIIGRCDLLDDPDIEQWLRLYIQLELEKAEGLRYKRERIGGNESKRNI